MMIDADEGTISLDEMERREIAADEKRAKNGVRMGAVATALEIVGAGDVEKVLAAARKIVAFVDDVESACVTELKPV